MNRKLWFSGGEPNIVAEDLTRDSDASVRLLEAAMNAWLIGYNENYIIEGINAVVTDGVNCVVEAGYIYLNGEILRVDPQTVAYVSTNEYYFEKEITYDPLGDKTFNDAVFHRTWQKNRGKLVNSPVTPVPTNKCNVKGQDWPEKVRQSIRGKYVGITTPADREFTWDENYLRANMSGSASTYILTIPDADDPDHHMDVNFIWFMEEDPLQPRCTYEIRDKSGTLLWTETQTSFTILVNDNGTWRLSAYIILDRTDPDPKLVELPIGAWNMKGNPILTLPHTFGDKNLIKQITARVYNDIGDTLYEFLGDGAISWDNADIHLARGSLFNGNDFDDSVMDRGIIYIQT